MRRHDYGKWFLFFVLTVLFATSTAVGLWMWKRNMLLFVIGYLTPVLMAACFAYSAYHESKSDRNA